MEEAEETLLPREHKPLEPISVLRLVGVTAVLGGVQFGWALQLSLLTPYVQDLGIKHENASLIWLCGPIAGLLVQPIAGWYSDNCTSRFGRRRPFIVTGLVLVVVAMLLISNASDIGHQLGDPAAPAVSTKCNSSPSPTDTTSPGPTPQPVAPRPWAIAFFVVGFWILDISNNMMQGPCRALVGDLASPSQHYIGMALITAWIGVGNAAGYGAGWVDWSGLLPMMITDGCNANCANLRAAFVLAMFAVTIPSIVTCCIAKEVPIQKQDKGENPFKAVLKACRTMERPMRWICTVMFCNWVGLYCFFLFNTDWFGRNIYGGAPSDPDPNKTCLYNEGVRMGSLGLLVQSVVSLILCLVVPPVVTKFGPKRVWVLGLILFALMLFATAIPQGAIAGVVLFGSLGIPWSITLVVPFGMVTRIAGTSRGGILMGVLNIFVVLPQIAVSAGNPLFEMIPFVKTMGDPASFIAGGVCALVGAAICLKIPEDNVDTDHLPSDAQELPTDFPTFH
mmetsp:Transcript_1551/g.3504  ORF Transcript_1551/g.3504 Transcript_1551/m.3504 type:complete len:507 (+) Transcript_1551:39-1559(+)